MMLGTTNIKTPGEYCNTLLYFYDCVQTSEVVYLWDDMGKSYNDCGSSLRKCIKILGRFPVFVVGVSPDS